MIKIDCDTYEDFKSEFHFSKGMENEKNIEYIKRKWKEIITNQEESLVCTINEDSDSFAMARLVNDNRGELWASDDDGNEIGVFYFYADVSI